MKTFAINTLGCKVNQYESQQIRELLERFGLAEVNNICRPDLFVINTCCVTQSASAKSRQLIRKARKLSPSALIIVTGCLSTFQNGELDGIDEKACLITPRSELPVALTRIISCSAHIRHTANTQSHPHRHIKTESDSKIKQKNNLGIQPKFASLTSFKHQTRAFLKIQDGCDGYCTYCIIPRTRPDVRSKPVQLVLDEAKTLVEAGHKEIVITGIFLGAYGQSSVRRKNWENRHNDKLVELLDRVAEIVNPARIRLSSLEPGDVSSELLDVFCKRRNIMPHLHLSLQSGSEAVLKRMCRQYTAAEYREKVALIKSRLDRPAITTDIIVGFPGESDEDFKQTAALAEEVGFAKMHIFSFSPRVGTAAAKMQDTVNNGVIKRRAQILQGLEKRLAREFRQQFIGETDRVLVEQSEVKGAWGHSERYFMVQVRQMGGKLHKNDLVKVQLVENREDGMIGESVG